MPIETAELGQAVRDAGLADAPVCVHTSLRSFGTSPRADDVIDGFLTAGCTVMVPTFSHGIFGLRPPPHLRPARNGTDYDVSRMNDAGRDRVFDPSTNDVDETMGTLPRVALQRPDRVRGNHPISSFAAVGPLATQLISAQGPTDVYAPLAALARRGGYVVLVGVDLNRMTLIHFAEQRSGRVMFRRWANGAGGEPVMVESGGCSSGFGNFAPALRPIRTTLAVGESTWQIFPAKAALNIATHAIRRSPRITHCGADCARCDDAVRGGPIL